ncbi:hypothetical protein [Marinisporobacter balticus]|uniref:YceG-like family protein n=1 Tax=Marinisporobacter balticus TaxID=2018667 RepID=A0A4R2L7D7_9FIRM|nr:hypothetical protein [Marinisporobacter balticus]TCO79916.1 hypothetical protein EV214_101150 [Marinisporobacter balticus]
MRKNILVGVLLGIGIGLILSSVFHIVKHENKQILPDEKFIKSEARKLGMIDPVEYFDKGNINNENIKNINEPVEKKTDERMVVKIPRGYKSEDISKVLKQKKLIVSEESFLNIINNKGLENKLRWGIYEFNAKELEVDIIDRIVKGNYIKE